MSYIYVINSNTILNRVRLVVCQDWKHPGTGEDGEEIHWCGSHEFTQENHEQTMKNPRKNYGKTMEKLRNAWKQLCTYRKIMEQLRKSMDKPWKALSMETKGMIYTIYGFGTGLASDNVLLARNITVVFSYQATCFFRLTTTRWFSSSSQKPWKRICTTYISRVLHMSITLEKKCFDHSIVALYCYQTFISMD